MIDSLWYNVNEKTNLDFAAIGQKFLKKIGFSTVIIKLYQWGNERKVYLV